MIRFAKAHAYGNDFLYVDKGDIKGLNLPALAREMCERHTGIGADGLIVYGRTAAGATMELFNADGGRAEVSGNGVRGLAALLLLGDDRDDAAVTITTEAGPKRVTRAGVAGSRPTFRTAMGLPIDLRKVTLDAAGNPLTPWSGRHRQPAVHRPRRAARRRGAFTGSGAALEHPFFRTRPTSSSRQSKAPARSAFASGNAALRSDHVSGTGSCARRLSRRSRLAERPATASSSRRADLSAWNGATTASNLTGWASISEGNWLGVTALGCVPPPRDARQDSSFLG